MGTGCQPEPDPTCAGALEFLYPILNTSTGTIAVLRTDRNRTFVRVGGASKRGGPTVQGGLPGKRSRGSATSEEDGASDCVSEFNYIALERRVLEG